MLTCKYSTVGTILQIITIYLKYNTLEELYYLLLLFISLVNHHHHFFIFIIDNCSSITYLRMNGVEHVLGTAATAQVAK